MALSEKILIIGPAWVGDMVLAQSLLIHLKNTRPNAQIDVAAPAWTLPLLARMPQISRAIALPFQHGQAALGARYKFGKSLKNQGYTQSIILTNSFKSAIIPWAAGIQQRTSFLGEMRYGLINDIRPLDKTKLKKTVERFVSLGLRKGENLPASLPLPALTAQTDYSALAQQFGVSTKGPILGLCPGAEYGEAKRWPAEYYAEVAKAAIEKGWQVWLFGSAKDNEICNKINNLTVLKCQNFAGKTKLDEAIDLMNLCNTIISNDSGLMHIAAALMAKNEPQKKLVAIFGSSDPTHTPPMHPSAIVEYLGLDCSPCFKRSCPLQGDAHLACLKNIMPAKIIQYTH